MVCAEPGWSFLDYHRQLPGKNTYEYDVIIQRIQALIDRTQSEPTCDDYTTKRNVRVRDLFTVCRSQSESDSDLFLAYSVCTPVPYPAAAEFGRKALDPRMAVRTGLDHRWQRYWLAKVPSPYICGREFYSCGLFVTAQARALVRGLSLEMSSQKLMAIIWSQGWNLEVRSLKVLIRVRLPVYAYASIGQYASIEEVTAS